MRKKAKKFKFKVTHMHNNSLTSWNGVFSTISPSSFKHRQRCATGVSGRSWKKLNQNSLNPLQAVSRLTSCSSPWAIAGSAFSREPAKRPTCNFPHTNLRAIDTYLHFWADERTFSSSRGPDPFPLTKPFVHLIGCRRRRRAVAPRKIKVNQRVKLRIHITGQRKWRGLSIAKKLLSCETHTHTTEKLQKGKYEKSTMVAIDVTENSWTRTGIYMCWDCWRWCWEFHAYNV